MKHYELQLPSDYKLIKIIDCKDSKTIVLFNVFGLLISIILIAIGIYIKVNFVEQFNSLEGNIFFLVVLSFFFAYILIIILHELIHGLFYKIFTKQKLTFGITLSAAFCGVPNIYVRKKAMIITCIAPCVILSFILLIAMIISYNSFIYVLFLLLFSLHFGGCIGDLYCVILFVFKYRKKDLLINDTGLKQSIYIKKNI